jgi:TonB-linked SusC/RagA family outer membrane protein
MWYTWQWENFANYETSFGKDGKHGFQAMLGISAMKYQNQWNNSLSGPMFKEQSNFAQHGNAEIDGTVAGNLTEQTTQSYFGRVGYDYDGRYLLQVIVRADGTSLLAQDQQWGTFPSVSAGWILSHEKFWNVDFIDFFKIRASWGQNGSTKSLSPDQFRALINANGIKYPKPGGGYYTGAEPALLANTELTWETSTQTDIGFDMHMWNSRLLVGFDWFYKVTEDLLTAGTPPPSVGNYAPFVNAGDITNKGIEFEAGLRKFEGKFNYDMAFNFTYILNDVTYLNPLLERTAGAGVGTGWTATWMELGYPVWYFRGYKTDGIFQTEEQIATYKADNGGLAGYDPKPGDPIVVNTNGDNLINDDDQTYIGDPHPDFYWGANFNFAYSGFDLKLFIQGVHGQDVLMGFNRYDRSTSNRPQFFYDDRWTPENKTNDWFRPDNSSPYIYNSDLMVFNGSYIRIKQIQLGYTLPRKTMDKMKIYNLRFYISMDDYFTFTTYPGMDPDAGSQGNTIGIDKGLYPAARKLIFGLSFGF